MLMKKCLRNGLILSLFLAVNLSMSGQEIETTRAEMYSDLKNEGLLIVFPAFEVHKKTVQEQPQLQERYNEMISESKQRKEGYIQTFRDNYSFSNVYYIDAKEGDLDKVRAGDYSLVEVIRGDKSKITNSGNLILVYPYSEVAAFHSDNGLYLSYLDKSKPLPRNFPKSIYIGPTSFRYLFLPRKKHPFTSVYILEDQFKRKLQ